MLPVGQFVKANHYIWWLGLSRSGTTCCTRASVLHLNLTQLRENRLPARDFADAAPRWCPHHPVRGEGFRCTKSADADCMAGYVALEQSPGSGQAGGASGPCPSD